MCQRNVSVMVQAEALTSHSSSEARWPLNLSFTISRLSCSRMSPNSSRIATWYSKAAAFKVEQLFSRKKVAGPRRTVFVNEDTPDDYRDHRNRVKSEHVYSSNQVITSKYTIITFIPRNLLEQFRRVANMLVFFLNHLSDAQCPHSIPILTLCL